MAAEYHFDGMMVLAKGARVPAAGAVGTFTDLNGVESPTYNSTGSPAPLRADAFGRVLSADMEGFRADIPVGYVDFGAGLRRLVRAVEHPITSEEAQRIADETAASVTATIRREVDARVKPMIADPNDAAVRLLVQDHGSSTATALREAFPERSEVVGRVQPDAARLVMPDRVLPTPTTPEGDKEVVHPSVVRVPGGWNGHEYWMAITPMPGGAFKAENPCIYVSDDGDTWTAPAGLTNPIEPAPAGANDYNADTDLILGPDDRLYCFWNMVVGDQYTTYYRASADGVDWSDRKALYTTTTTQRRFLSPSVALHDGTWHIWAFDMAVSPVRMVHMSAASLDGPWDTATAETATIYPPLPATREPWHAEVRRYGDEWHAVMADTAKGSSGAGDLYFMTSRDGIAWRRGLVPMVPRKGAYHNQLYRSTFVLGGSNGQAGYDAWVTVYGGGTKSPGITHRLARGRIVFDSQETTGEKHVREMLAARVPLAPFVAGDTFARADGPLGTADSGQAWTILSGTPTIENRLVQGATRAVVECGISDGYFETEIRQCITSGDGAVLFRAGDLSNYWAFGWVNYYYRLTKVVAGVTTHVRQDDNSLIPSVFGLNDDPIRVGVRVIGNVIRCYVNGIPWGDPVYDTALQANTKHGFTLSDGGTRMGHFIARSLREGTR